MLRTDYVTWGADTVYICRARFIYLVLGWKIKYSNRLLALHTDYVTLGAAISYGLYGCRYKLYLSRFYYVVLLAVYM